MLTLTSTDPRTFVCKTLQVNSSLRLAITAGLHMTFFLDTRVFVHLSELLREGRTSNVRLK